MLAVYLACLVLGGTLVALSVSGGFGDLDADADVGGDLDVNADAGALHSFAQLVSLRGAVFFVAFFGLTGTALSMLRFAGPLTLVSSIGMGAVAGALVQRAFDYLRRTETGAPADLADLEGHAARLTVGCSRGERGKIAIELEDRRVQLLASVAPEAARDAFAAGERVLVLRIRDGVAEISEEEILS